MKRARHSTVDYREGENVIFECPVCNYKKVMYKGGRLKTLNEGDLSVLHSGSTGTLVIHNIDFKD